MGRSRKASGRQHPAYPLAFPGCRRGVDDLLGVPDLDVLAGDRADDRCGEPVAQPPLSVGMFAGRPVAHRQQVGVQVVGDQLRPGPFCVHRAGAKPLPDLLQLGGQLRLGRALPELPLPVLGEHRPPRLPGGPRRVHQDPELQLDHRTIGLPDGLAGIPAHAGAFRRAAWLGPPGRAP